MLKEIGYQAGIADENKKKRFLGRGILLGLLEEIWRAFLEPAAWHDIVK
jgi:hypothetical protein